MTRVQQSGIGGPRLRRLWLKGLAWSVLVWSGTGLHTAVAQDQGTPSDEKRTEWFRHDKFGMFIHWGYNKYDQDWKSPETIVRNLADIAGKGGNYLLNVGPTAEGTIPDGSIRTLRDVGKWMKVNGDSIYGTTASPFAKTPWGRCTAKHGKLYLHVFEWPSDGKLTVAGLENQVNKAYLLAAPSKPCAVTAGNGQVTIAVPPEMPDRIDTVVVLEIQGDPQVSQAQ